MRLAVLILSGVLALCAATVAVSRPSRGCAVPPDAVLVPLGEVPPDACLAYFGPGPCHEHGQTAVGSTDAVALWPMPDEARPGPSHRAPIIRVP